MAELPPPPNRKAGWYADPEGSGRLRFWNKTRWTDEFRDAPGGQAKPSGSGPDSASPSPVGGNGGGSGTSSEPQEKRGVWLGAPWWAWLIGAFVVLVIVSAIAGGNDSSDDTTTQAGQPHSVSVKTVTQAAPAQPPAPAQPVPAPTATAVAENSTPDAPEMTAGQEQALRSAQDYLSYTSFSRAGLIEQLSSSAGEGFSKADATYAADHVGADWNEEAVKSAKDYLSYTSFSRSGLIEQLSSSAGEGFTHAQAEYAVNQVYGR